MEDDEILVPISAVEHWSYCRRQAGLIHVDQVWADSALTVGGQQLHESVDLPGLENRPGIRKARALPLRSEQYGLVGRADLVYFLEDPAYNQLGRPYPVEYKRGAKSTFRHPEFQLCAQALCLEEMLSAPVPLGAIYYGSSRRRREIEFGADLRDRTIAIVRDIAVMLRAQRTPPPEPGPKCDQCSLLEICMPLLPGRSELERYLVEL